MENAAHILIVDDDTRLRDLLRKFLSEAGFRVTAAEDAAAARAKLKGIAFDLLVVDVMMPGESGLDLTRALRGANGATSTVPILMLTAMGEPDDRISGLEHGADDYLSKPFEPRELLLRIHNILKRTQPAAAAAAEVLFGPWRFDVAREALWQGDDPVRLTEAEGRLLAVLARKPGATVSRDELAEATGGDVNSRSIDVQVTRLRRKIESDPKVPRHLQTVRGKGYVLWAD